MSYLYINCPEHPKIAHILRNGESNCANIADIKKELYREKIVDLQFQWAENISEEEYTRLCCKRRTLNCYAHIDAMNEKNTAVGLDE